MKPVIVFDLNETLLDMSGLDPAFARIFDQPEGRELRKKWFAQVLELFMTATITGKYRSFDKLAIDALQMLAAQREREASVDDRTRLEESIAGLTVYPDVRPGLERLKQAGFTVATLTNSGRKSATTHLERAGVRALFDEVLSVEAVERYKPAREAYEYAAKALKVDLGDILLVAAHGWDIAGAKAAGCDAAFLARPGKALSPHGPEPKYQARDLVRLAETIAAHRR